VWFTKQWPEHKWVELIQLLPEDTQVYLTGGPDDAHLCERIAEKAGRIRVTNVCGKLSLLESASLMKDAEMNYVNDSAPMHLCSSVNAPVTAIYCSTVPSFGFGPISSRAHIVETRVKLDCRPCGLHGFNACPKGHFKCAEGISAENVLSI
jgi:heptosyltransferase-2